MDNPTVLKYGSWEDSLSVRIPVFVDEQGYKNEIDDIDDIAYFVNLKIGERAVGTGRVFCDNGSGTFILGRIAVLKDFRGNHFGAMIVKALEDIAVEKGANRLELHAQDYAVPFYEKYGFSVVDGTVEYDEGNPHIKMFKKV